MITEFSVWIYTKKCKINSLCSLSGLGLTLYDTCGYFPDCRFQKFKVVKCLHKQNVNTKCATKNRNDFGATTSYRQYSHTIVIRLTNCETKQHRFQSTQLDYLLTWANIWMCFRYTLHMIENFFLDFLKYSLQFRRSTLSDTIYDIDIVLIDRRSF